MIPEQFVYLAVVLNCIATGGYVMATLRGTAKPNRVTWALWGLAPLVAFFAEVEEGVGLRSLLTLSIGVLPFLVVAASFFNREAVWKLTRFDAVCGVLSVLGIVAWRVSGDANLAIVFALIADALAAAPTVVKSYRAPDTEHPPAFALSAAAAGITLLTLTSFSFADVAFPLYIFVANLVLLFLLVTRIGVRGAVVFVTDAERDATTDTTHIP